MGVTLAQLIQGVGNKISARTRTLTAAGTGAASTWTDATNLADTPADWYNEMWLYHATDNKEWRISDDDGAGALTLDTTATPTSTSDYEILPVRPSRLVYALNSAAERFSHLFGVSLVDNSHVTDSPIYNAGFEETTSATAITGWTATTVTMTRESGGENKLGGQYSIALTTANGYIEPAAEFQGRLTDLAGYAPVLYVPCKTSTASTARISWVIDGTTTYSSYHAGGGGWETLSVTAPTIANPVDAITFRLYREAGGTVYYDNAWMENTPRLYNYRIRADLVNGPSYIRVQGISDRNIRHNLVYNRYWAGWQHVREEDATATTSRNTLFCPHPPPFGRWFMVGTGLLNTLSVRADIAELDRDDAELLELAAAVIALEELQLPAARQRIVDLRAAFNQLSSKHGEVLGAAQF